MKPSIYIVFVFIFCCSCKSPQKVINESKLNIEEIKSNNLLLTTDDELIKLSEQSIKRLMNEKLNIDIVHLEYDTSQYIIAQTAIRISKDAEVNEESITYHCEEKATSAEAVFSSQAETKIETESREKVIKGLRIWQKALIGIGGFAILGFLIFIRYKK